MCSKRVSKVKFGKELWYGALLLTELLYRKFNQHTLFSHFVSTFSKMHTYLGPREKGMKKFAEDISSDSNLSG